MTHTKSNFIFVNNIDPHRDRRYALLTKYPQIRSLIGIEKKTKYIVLILVLLQLIVAYYSQNLDIFWYFIILYCVGATVSHMLFTTLHEVTHNLAFKAPFANRCLAILANLPLGIPAAMGFQKYHHLHHRFMGDEKQDVDIPLRAEAKMFRSSRGKFIWLLCQPFTYTLRPWIKLPQKITLWEWINLGIQILFNFLIISLFGYQYFMFLILSTLIGLSLHPMAGHFIAEHYVTHEQQETYSYYGFFNYLTLNVGHHVEHHDFPSIPWSKISQLKKIAPEYYESLYVHKSWLGFTKKFIFSKNLNLFSRIIRPSLGSVDDSSYTLPKR